MNRRNFLRQSLVSSISIGVAGSGLINLSRLGIDDDTTSKVIDPYSVVNRTPYLDSQSSQTFVDMLSTQRVRSVMSIDEIYESVIMTVPK